MEHKDSHELRTLLERARTNVITENVSEFRANLPRLQELARKFIDQHGD